MEHTDGRFHPFGRGLGQDLAWIEQGEDTGWFGPDGNPVSWPQDFLDPEAGWHNRTVYATGGDVQPYLPTPTNPDEAPF
ncbi:hypothetical protein PBI_COLLEEN_29 [Corynebacterium phage Colleen]|uniref:Uncharacterized protein n=4 Tax=root TaxID=1 RepID=W5Y533_9CORY|nr:hypothetical protein [Corynebacterium vitaeruminis]YP_009626541.1 hypothetical protein FDK28_gp29 [Corynebacterium phage Poushou]AWY06477.1 hypothetical protein PBI_TOUCHMENOT_29 [Corynebacterium phage TouchMeNot]QFG14778.1 hypothetical protein PBI_COLLEEN_29 [Corynebacterium phage Colleen]UVT31915.1 hypothetical protein PBI_ARIANNA_29 [Corynebacterium phage Arianna]AHI21618.1 hypothetical protein B843_01110 [Corynebacterium vitaeruminis DSM 20294]ASJ78988.1 hypothetical protein PBI_POUSHO